MTLHRNSYASILMTRIIWPQNVLMAIVMVADLSVVLDLTGEVGCNQFLYVTAASADDLDSLGFENILGSLTHIPGKHHYHAHLLEHRGDAALASATLRRSHSARSDDLSVDDIKYSVIGTMTEMIIYPALSCWHCYLHIT